MANARAPVTEPRGIASGIKRQRFEVIVVPARPAPLTRSLLFAVLYLSLDRLLDCRSRGRDFRLPAFAANDFREEDTKVPPHRIDRRQHDDPQHRAAHRVKKNLPVNPRRGAGPGQMRPGSLQLWHSPKLDGGKRFAEI